MAKNINHLQHIKSSVVENGKPKLPQPSVLVEGELAINYAEGVETISLKNSSGDVVAFSSDEYYTEQKLGSGFTGENSAKTVTEAIESIDEVQISSGITPEEDSIEIWIDESVDPEEADVYTKAETDELLVVKVDKTSIVQETGSSVSIIMSQSAVTDAVNSANEIEISSGVMPSSSSIEIWVDESYSSATADVYSKAEMDSLFTLKQDVIEDNAVIGGGYGICRTAGVTSAKTAAINDFVLVPNMHVSVLFEHAFEVSNPTLNINDTGAYPIMLYNYPVPMFKITEETILTMVFDGTNYNVVSIEREVSLSGVSAVDLGLPSGVKWASMNVEAQTPEDNGLYFSWGNVIGHAKGSEPDFGTSNDTEPYVSSKGAEITGGSGTQIAVGNTYDMAHATMGYPWRLPTYADFQELCSNCTSTWVTQNGVRGRRFVSNINGEAIFFPATGYYNSTILTDEGTYGKYWSSVLASESAAHDFSFNSESVNYQNSNQRYLGFNVRAVQ